MDYVKLAQICNKPFEWLPCIENKEKLKELKDIAKGLDVHYCIPDGPSVYFSKQNRSSNYSGYNCLHFAVMQGDHELVSQFLSQGADLFKQGMHDGCTPIHVAIIMHDEIKNSKKKVWEILGPLKEDKSISILLSTHIRSKNKSNPKCKVGISHFHVACMVDHVEAVEFFLKNGEPVNQVMDADSQWPGYTPLHFAVKYASDKVAKLLIEHGADLLKNDGIEPSIFNLATECLIYSYDYLLRDVWSAYKYIYEKDIEKYEKIITAIIESISNKENILNFVGDDGLTICHVASMLKEQTFLEKVLNENFDLNVTVKKDSSFWPGWTPLHFAACTNYENFKLLLKHGAKIDFENSKGETPLDLLMRNFSPKIVSDILSTEDTLKNIQFSDNQTKLVDALLAMNESQSFNFFIDNLTDKNIILPVDSPIWPKCSLLHVALMSKCFMITKDDPQSFYRKFELINGKFSFNFVHDTTESRRYNDVIETCIKSGCKVDEQNKKGDTAIHMAFKRDNDRLVRMFMKYCEKNAVDADNLSIQHIAHMTTDDTDFFGKRLFRGSGGQSSHMINREFKRHIRRKQHPKRNLATIRARSTALHMAVIFENEDLIDPFVGGYLDLFAQDSAGLTPFHLSLPNFSDSNEELSALLLSQVNHLPNMVSKDGLSHVHVTAFANDKTILEELISEGADVNVVTLLPERFAGQTPLHIAANAGCAEAVQVLIEAGANIYKENTLKKYETPLLYAINSRDRNTIAHFVENIKRKMFSFELLKMSGLTLLHLACALLDIEWVEKLLKIGNNPNAQIRSDFEFDLAGFTPLHVTLNSVIMNDKGRTRGPSIPERLRECVELLLRHGADVTIMSKLKGSALHMIFNQVIHHKDYLDNLAPFKSIAESMLRSQMSYDVNPIDSEKQNVGFSHFHLACILNDVEVVKKFLKNDVDINYMVNPFAHHNPGYTGLHFAMKYHCLQVARFLIQRGANLELEDSNGNTPFHTAMMYKFAEIKLMEMLVEHGANIQAENLNFKNPFYCLVESNGLNVERLQFFVNHGCEINNTYIKKFHHQGIIGLALKKVSENSVPTALDALIKVCKIRSKIRNGFNPIYNAVAIRNNNNGEITTDIYKEIILRFIDMGCDIDQRVDCTQCSDVNFSDNFEGSEGNTPLHVAVDYRNYNAVNALLQLGADINVTKTNHQHQFHKTPFMEFLVRGDLQTFKQDPSRTCARLAKLFADHVSKMNLIDFYVHPMNERHAAMVHDRYPFLRSFEDSCLNELTKMEKVEVDVNLTLHRFLTSRAIVFKYPTMSLFEREVIDNFFKDFHNLRKEYPQFCGLIMMKYRRLKNRMENFQEAKNSFIYLCNVQLPDRCTETILEFLTNEDIKILLDNVSNIKKIKVEGLQAKRPCMIENAQL